ncbi:MAG: cyclic nucleotide-binding domain-containing protein [Betaproteobacteria bacterium]
MPNSSSLLMPGRSTQDLLIKLIENVAVFESFTPAELLELLTGSEKRMAKKGEVIIREGDSGRFMYLLIEGEAQVSKQGKDIFVTHSLAALKPGECFGEMALVDPALRSATVEALTDCVMIRFQESDCWKNPAISSKIYRNIARILASRLRELQQIVINGDPGELFFPSDTDTES